MEGLYAVGSRRVDAERAFRTRFCLERRRPDCAIFDSMAIGICYLQYGGIWRKLEKDLRDFGGELGGLLVLS